MALSGKDVTKILVGGAELFTSPYVTNAGAGTFSSFGHTLEPTEWALEYEDFDVVSELSIGRVKTVPINANYSIKAVLGQNDPAAMLIMSRQLAAQLTGTPPNDNLAFSDPVEIYYQLKLVGVGFGTTKVDTYTFWRCQVASVEPIQYAKAGVQRLAATWKVLRDDSIVAPTTNGFYAKRVST
jgi:hypothetical protein